MQCNVFQQRLFDFQADELPEPERESFQAHLDACPSCARRLEVENALLASLKGGLSRRLAPADLYGRVRAALRQVASPRPVQARGLPGGWLGAVAAVLLVGLVAMPLLLAPAWRWKPVPVKREVLVVDLVCDRAGVGLAAQRQCRHPEHANALKIGDGRYWSVSLDTAAGRRLVLDPHLRGRRVEVQGEWYAPVRTLFVREASDLGPPAHVALRGSAGRDPSPRPVLR